MGVTQALDVVATMPDDASPADQAEAVGLTYTSDEEPGITRLRWGRGFTYRDADGATVPRGSDLRAHIEALAIPPAWTDVWICADASGHVQATGRDDAGRKQYRYHDRWRNVRDATKFHRLADVHDALPAVRETVDRHLRMRRFTEQKVLALVTALLDETLIRVGNEEYARTNGSRGLTTLRCDHVDVAGATVRFAFPGKSGRDQELALRNRRLAGQLLRCEEIPGQRLFAYETPDGWRDVDSQAVNDYLRAVAGDDLTAKDFRTWGATAVAAEVLHATEGEPTDLDARILAAVDAAAERLGNTRAVARASYVDPRVLAACREERLDAAWDDNPGVVERRSPAERAVGRVVAAGTSGATATS